VPNATNCPVAASNARPFAPLGALVAVAVGAADGGREMVPLVGIGEGEAVYPADGEGVAPPTPATRFTPAVAGRYPAGPSMTSTAPVATTARPRNAATDVIAHDFLVILKASAGCYG
jgi:hypothetical protein